MKKIIYYVAISVMRLLPSSCSLEEETRIEVEKKNYVNSTDKAEGVLLGVYRTTIEDAMYGYHLSILFDLETGISQVERGRNENFRITPTNSFPTAQSEVQQTQAALYAGTYKASDFLKRIFSKTEPYTSTDKKLGTIYIAKARTLRAMFCFELVRRFGGIVSMTNTEMSNQDPVIYIQSAPEKVYGYTEDDLLYASDILPYAVDDQYRENNEYRSLKEVTLRLLTKVYAAWARAPVKDTSRWEATAKTARILIESGEHGLLTDYEQLQRNTCNGVWDPTENLIEISFYPPAVSGSGDPVRYIGKRNRVKTTAIASVRGSCAANVKVVHTFVLSWRENVADIRRDLSVASYQYTDAKKTLWATSASDTEESTTAKDADPTKAQKNKQNYAPAEWDIEKYVTINSSINNDKSDINWYFLRYTDTSLLCTKASNEWKHGPVTDAYSAVNAVRRHSYGNPGNISTCDLTEGLDEEGFREAVHKERSYGLSSEGHQRVDLARWGICYNTIQETAKELGYWWESAGSPNYSVATYTINDKHELFPIPQRDMDLCILFSRNLKW